MEKRKQILIHPSFQFRMMLRIVGWVTLATVLTGVVLWLFLRSEDARLAGDFFYVTQQAGSHPVLLKRSQIVLPSLVLSLLINLALSLLFGLLYSHRLAGPIHRITHDLRRLIRGDHPGHPFKLRESDEFQEVAQALDEFIRTQHEGKKR